MRAATLAIVLAIGGAPHGAARGIELAPDPGGDERAKLAAPPGVELGFNDSFQLEGLGARLQASLVGGIGGTAVRMPMQWWGLEPERGEWHRPSWAARKAAYNQFLTFDIRPHFSITHAPPWARETAEQQSCLTRSFCNFPPARPELGAWKRFVRELATRFPEATLEVWNEPNFLGSWRSGVDPERYAELLAAAYEATRSVNPRTRVMMGGLGTSTKERSLDYRTFLERAYAADPSLREHTDALNLHVYPTLGLGAGTFFARVMHDFREVRAAYGDSETPIFVSEVGATTSGPNALSELEQASLVVRVTRRLLTMPDVSGVLIHRLVDSAGHPPTDPEQGYGLLRHPPVEPKLAYCALSRATAILYPLCHFRQRFPGAGNRSDPRG